MSELSNALNPHIAYSRSRPSPTFVNTQPQAVADSPPAVTQQTYVNVPHRSELEFAISEPPPPPTVQAPVVIPTNSRPDGGQVIQELLRALHASKQAFEGERKRRIAWEQELEAKYAQRQAVVETQLAETRQEVACLRAYIASLGPVAGPSRIPSSLLIEARPSPALTHSPSITVTQTPSPAPVPVPAPHPMFVSQPGAPNTPMQLASPPLDHSSIPHVPESEFSPSPGLSQSRSHSTPASSGSKRKRRTPVSESEEESAGSEDSRSSAGRAKPLKRRNKHDTRCYTIQTAMRKHIYRCMKVSPDSELPPSHLEGLHLGDSEPVRFVWDKTPKQSAHNARMKTRIITDIKANRGHYKHVLDKDFTKKVLDSAFDQAFTTFRQKAKGQSDEAIAKSLREKEEGKAMKSRRNARKKGKLNNRIEARQKVEVFAHPTFSGALQFECMSSEESEDDSSSQRIPGPSTAMIPSSKEKTLIIRGKPWRSTRLLRFFNILDSEDSLSALSNRSSSNPDSTSVSSQAKNPPRRPRQPRTEGPPKFGLRMPPKGVSEWMISRRWLKDLQLSHPEKIEKLKELVRDESSNNGGNDWQGPFDWGGFDMLGYESDDELDPVELVLRSQRLVALPDHLGAGTGASGYGCQTSTMSYSLQHALAPVQ